MSSNSKLMSLPIIVFWGLILSGCDLNLIDPLASSQAPPPVASSGVQGQVLRGPVHAGPPAAGDNAYIGFAALFYVIDEAGHQVASFNSDSMGWFILKLSPGRYEIVPDQSAPLIDPELQRQPVTVTKGVLSNVVLHFDGSN